MVWKKGQSGNPQGRRPAGQRLVEVDTTNAPYQKTIEKVYVSILDKRDPAKELIRLADKSKDQDFKRQIWMFLFQEKYKGSHIMAGSRPDAPEASQTDAEMLKELEGQVNEIRPLESKPVAPHVNLQDVH